MFSTTFEHQPLYGLFVMGYGVYHVLLIYFFRLDVLFFDFYLFFFSFFFCFQFFFFDLYFISSFLSRSVIVFILCERTVFFFCCHRKTRCRFQRWVTNFRLSLLIFTRRNMKTLSNSIDVEQISPWMTKSKLSKLYDYKEKAINCQYVFETVSVNENM